MRHVRLLTGALLALSPMASAQTAAPAPHATPPDAFVYQPAAEVAALTHRADGKPQSKIVIDHENYFIEYVTRTINTQSEAHGHWYDYIHVLDGEGTITYGGTQAGAHDVGDLAMRGGARAGWSCGDGCTFPPPRPATPSPI